MDHYAKSYPIYSRIPDYRGFKNMLYSLRKYESSEVGKEKMKIIKFYEEYGEKATKEAFGADRKLISKWKGLLNKSA